MKIYVDADACPVVRIVEKIASDYKVPWLLEKAVTPFIRVENGIQMRTSISY